MKEVEDFLKKNNFWYEGDNVFENKKCRIIIYENYYELIDLNGGLRDIENCKTHKAEIVMLWKHRHYEKAEILPKKVKSRVKNLIANGYKAFVKKHNLINKVTTNEQN